jgi:hypothetical protein
VAQYLKNEDWRLIAEEVTKETDPKKADDSHYPALPCPKL